MVIYGYGGVILKGNETLLMLRQNNSKFNDEWSNPGGKGEEGESEEETVIRELYEELGIKVNVIRFLATYEDYVDEKLFGLYKGYLVEIISGEPKIMEPHKCLELKWFSLDELPKNLAPYAKKYLENI
jgi:8-oxo-dGTP diphosphatase